MMAGLLLLLPFLLPQDPQLNVAEDLALQKKITVTIKSEPLNDALKVLGKEAGIPCVAVQNLWDLKVTVFAKDEPAGPLMDRIADVLGAEWTKEGDVYRLGYERLALQQRVSYEQAEQRLMRERLDDALLAYTRLAGANPTAPKPDLRKLTLEEKARVDTLSKDPSAVVFGAMLSQMASASNSGFWRGETRTFAPVDKLSSQQPAFEEEKRIFARFDPYLVCLERNPGRDPQLARKSLFLFGSPPESLSQMPFAKEVSEWPSMEAPEDDKRFQKSVTPVPFRKSDFFVRAIGGPPRSLS
jgi:hypothetical protein